MRMSQLSRTATFAWGGPPGSAPLIATGAVAGAMDENFSNDSQLEIWSPELSGDDKTNGLESASSQPIGSVKTNARFNRIAWSYADTSRTQGVIAAGMESGEVSVYDADKIITGSDQDAQIFKTDKHTGPVKGLDFNDNQKNLLLTGAVAAEIHLWDLNSNSPTPTSCGPTSTKLDEITAIQWNPSVARVFAASSSSGYTSIWDLKASKEVISLTYGGGAGRGMGHLGGQTGLQMGKRRGMSDVCWHPEISTRVVTCSEDDESPVIMVWDLRNTRAPEKILSGHQKGVLSVSWCKQDSDLLLSCGKDNRTLIWNPQTCEVVGEVPPSNDWSFQTSWCPRNPDLLATASFDGTIGIHSLQSTRLSDDTSTTTEAGRALQDTFGASADDPFAQLASSRGDSVAPLSLKQPPKWLRRPVSAIFGFGGHLVSTSNLASATGKTQSAVVHLQSVVGEADIVARAQKLDAMLGDRDGLADYCSGRLSDGQEQSDATWNALHSLFSSDSRDQLIEMLGFSKAEVTSQVNAAVERLTDLDVKESANPQVPGTSARANGRRSESEASPSVEAEAAESSSDKTEHADVPHPDVVNELFGEDPAPGTPAAATADADFFSSMASAAPPASLPGHIVPHTNYTADSSVAATVGSQASSVRSEVIQENNTFKIYPADESDTDRLITKSLVFGDYASAVSLCLASDRYADALLLAVQGGPELLLKTQKAYFERRTTAFPFLRLFQSIAANDLIDIVQNADLAEWQVVFVVVCTFAKETEFASLTEQLGQRLDFKARMMENSESSEAKETAVQLKKDATLCFLAARKLEKVVNIWIDELKSEETASMRSPQGSRSPYTAHAQALQTFIEKVAIFEAATGYVDDDLMSPTQSADAALAGARTYRLAGLYDRYYEYADLLAAQGLVDLAVKYASKTPADYKGTGAAGSQLDKARERLLLAAGQSRAPTPQKPAVASKQPAPAAEPQSYPPSAPYTAAPANPYQAMPAAAYQPTLNAPSYQPAPAISDHYAVSSPYGPSAPVQYNAPTAYGGSNPSPYAPAQSGPYGATYTPVQSYQVNAAPPPPPPAGSNTGSPFTSTTQRRDIPGWNDAPSLVAPKRPASVARESPKPQPIMSPFPVDPNAQFLPTQPSSQHAAPPPPQRQGPLPGVIPPPPRGAMPPKRQTPPTQTQPSFAPAPAGPAPPTNPPATDPPPPRAGGAPPRGGPPPGTLAGPPPRALSPLGPPGRVMSPSAMMQPRSNPSIPPLAGPPPEAIRNNLERARSPQSQLPPPPGSRLAGPPPPGRATAPRPAALPASQSPPVGVQAGSRPPSSTGQKATPLKYPPGDRQHIPTESRPIFEILSSELTRVQQMSQPASLKRIVDDTARRLNILFDGLNSETLSPVVIRDLLAISKAVAGRDANTALGLHVSMLTNADGDMTTWAPGIKQLIRLTLG